MLALRHRNAIVLAALRQKKTREPAIGRFGGGGARVAPRRHFTGSTAETIQGNHNNCVRI